jgi:hypothetical protein
MIKVVVPSVTRRALIRNTKVPRKNDSRREKRLVAHPSQGQIRIRLAFYYDDMLKS